MTTTTWQKVKGNYENSLFIEKEMLDKETGLCTFGIEGTFLAVAGSVQEVANEAVFIIEYSAIVYDCRIGL